MAVSYVPTQNGNTVCNFFPFSFLESGFASKCNNDSVPEITQVSVHLLSDQSVHHVLRESLGLLATQNVIIPVRGLDRVDEGE